MSSQSRGTIDGVQVAHYRVPLPVKRADARLRKREAYEFVTVRVVTSEGVSGTGWAYTNGPGATATFGLVCDVLAPSLLGKSVASPLDCWTEGHAALLGGGAGLHQSMALGAFDIAVWDASAQLLEIPLYERLGGAPRRVPTYCSGPDLVLEPDELAEELSHRLSQGYEAVKVNVGKDVRRDRERLKAARSVIGYERDLFCDASASWKLSDALAHLDDLLEYRVGFVEEPFVATDVGAYRAFRRLSKIPLAGGETMTSSQAFSQMLEAGCLDILQPDICRSGGFTEWSRVVAAAEVHNKVVMTHYTIEIAVHAACTSSAVRYVEMNDHGLTHMGSVSGGIEIGEGWAMPTRDPGHGVEFHFDPSHEIQSSSI